MNSSPRILATVRFLLCLCFAATRATAGVVLTTLFSFNGTNGAVPEATLIQGTDGLLYGTTIGGGTNGVSDGGDGTIFRISTNATFETLVFLDRNSAVNPQAGLELWIQLSPKALE